MKKILSVALLLALLVMALASCGDTTTAKADESKTPATEQPSAVESDPETAPASDDTAKFVGTWYTFDPDEKVVFPMTFSADGKGNMTMYGMTLSFGWTLKNGKLVLVEEGMEINIDYTFTETTLTLNMMGEEEVLYRTEAEAQAALEKYIEEHTQVGELAEKLFGTWVGEQEDEDLGSIEVSFTFEEDGTLQITVMSASDVAMWRVTGENTIEFTALNEEGPVTTVLTVTFSEDGNTVTLTPDDPEGEVLTLTRVGDFNGDLEEILVGLWACEEEIEGLGTTTIYLILNADGTFAFSFGAEIESQITGEWYVADGNEVRFVYGDSAMSAFTVDLSDDGNSVYADDEAGTVFVFTRVIGE